MCQKLRSLHMFLFSHPECCHCSVRSSSSNVTFNVHIPNHKSNYNLLGKRHNPFVDVAECFPVGCQSDPEGFWSGLPQTLRVGPE